MCKTCLFTLLTLLMFASCDRPQGVGPLPSPVGDDAPESDEQQLPSDVDNSVPEPGLGYHPEERDAILALKKLGATIPLNEEGRAKKVYLARSKKLTNQGMVHLKALRDVDELKLGNTKIDDAALENIAHLDKLEILSLNDTKALGPGLVHLAKMSRLHTLYLGKTKVSDDGLSHLAGLINMRSLDLNRTQITDESLKQLKNMQKLEYLDISVTEISDAGLEHLVALKGLRRTSLRQTRVSKDGINKLRAALPTLGEIQH